MMYLLFMQGAHNMAYNGLALGAVADFGAQNCQYTTIVDARQNVQLITSPAIAAKRLLANVLFTSKISTTSYIVFLRFS